MEDDAKLFLKYSGCCSNCISIFEGTKEGDLESEIGVPGSPQMGQLESNANNTIKVSDCSTKSTSISNGDLVNQLEKDVKKSCLSTCPTCLGLLQFCLSLDILGQLSDKILKEDSDSPSFTLTITLPIVIMIRIQSMWAHLVNKFPNVQQKPNREYHYGGLKERWRSLTAARLAKLVHKKYVEPEKANFTLAVNAEYANDVKECSQLDKLGETTFDIRRKQHRKFCDGVYSRAVIAQVLASVSDDQFLKVFDEPPAEPDVRVHFENSQCSHTAIYVAGRYNKYSRDLPQTPWFVEGVRRLQSSVEELIANKIQTHVRTKCVFSSSGREDVDVRCLGSGRPFVLECPNPRTTQLTPACTRQLQKHINTSTQLVQIKDLQLVTKGAVGKMKEGEEEKSKSYLALCLCRQGLADIDLEQLNVIKDLTLNQVTPLRVLHRRPLATRNRNIHSMQVKVVDEYFFKLSLVADAGTYIKEFVHGDFGRTTPNLGTILGKKVDIVALDVTNVKLDWPPSLGLGQE